MTEKDLIDALNSFQFKQTLDWTAYLAVILSAGFGAWLTSYFNAKGRNYANKEDFETLKDQLEKSTTLVENIKSKLSEKNWITQQVWVKKQEAYEVIFELLFHVKRYVSHQQKEYEDWEYSNHYYPEMAYETHDDGTQIRIWELEKEKYEEKTKDPIYKQEAESLKTNYDNSISSLFQIVEVKSIYLDRKVEPVIKELKDELSKTYETEGWDEHFFRVHRKTKQSIEDICKISQEELKIETP